MGLKSHFSIKDNMKNIEQQYMELVQRILDDGVRQVNRTGIDTFMVPGAMIQGDINGILPLLTARKMYPNGGIGELIGFLRGYTNAADFRNLGCNLWNANANETPSWVNNPRRKGEDDLGQLAYSVGWRNCPNGIEPSNPIDQVETLIQTIKLNPESRRMVVSAWHPELFDRSALPPCHITWGVIIDQSSHKLNLWFQMRSCDVYLGAPTNLMSYSLLAHMLAHMTGYNVGTLSGFFADCHLYENHLEVAKELVKRPIFDPPKLKINRTIDSNFKIEMFDPSDFEIIDYKHGTPLPAPMAV